MPAAMGRSSSGSPSTNTAAAGSRISSTSSVRVVAQTALEDADGGILVDGRMIAPPYTIEVIGDPHTLAQSLNFTGGFVEDIEGPSIGGSVVIDQVESVEIATLAEPREPEYAQPVE